MLPRPVLREIACGCRHPAGCTFAGSKVSCGDPGSPVNGSVSGNGVWRCGDLAVWHCTPKYLLTGATYAYCTDDGWSSPAPQCLPLPAPPAPSCLATFGGGDGITSFLATGGPSQMFSPNGQHSIDMQTDGNLCIYSLASGTKAGPSTWCSGGNQSQPGAFKTTMQTDGNLCTYPGTTAAGNKIGDKEQGEVWCSGSAGPGFKCAKPPCAYWAALNDDASLCNYTSHPCVACVSWSFFDRALVMTGVHVGTACEKNAPDSSAAWCSSKHAAMSLALKTDDSSSGSSSGSGFGSGNTVLDVKKLGAKGDGTTNDHAVIAAAFATAAAASAAGGTVTVVLPSPGVYIVDGPLVWNASNSLLSVEKGAVLRWFWDKELKFAEEWSSYEVMFTIAPTKGSGKGPCKFVGPKQLR